MRRRENTIVYYAWNYSFYKSDYNLWDNGASSGYENDWRYGKKVFWIEESKCGPSCCCAAISCFAPETWTQFGSRQSVRWGSCWHYVSVSYCVAATLAHLTDVNPSKCARPDHFVVFQLLTQLWLSHNLAIAKFPEQKLNAVASELARRLFFVLHTWTLSRLCSCRNNPEWGLQEFLCHLSLK